MFKQIQPRTSRWGGLPLAFLAIAAVFASWLPVRAANEIELVKVVDGLVTPVYVTDAGDGSGRLFVVEKGGTVRIVKNGQLVATPFLNISDRVADDGEAGLLSIAFPPNYATAGYFFVYYNHKHDIAAPEAIDQGHNEGHDTVVARFRVTSNPDVADPGQRRADPGAQPAVCEPQRWAGAALALTATSTLVLGDGGDGGDPQNQAQNKGTILGKILRVSVGATGTYTVPNDNPFRRHGGGEAGDLAVWAAQPVALEL